MYGCGYNSCGCNLTLSEAQAPCVATSPQTPPSLLRGLPPSCRTPDFPPHVGDLWISYNSVRGPVGLVWGLFGAGLGLFGPQTDLKSTPNDTDRTSDKLKLQPHEL